MTKNSHSEDTVRRLGFHEIRLVHGEQESSLVMDCEGSEFVRSVYTKVFGLKWNETDEGHLEEESRVLIAEVDCWLLLGGYAMNDGIDIVDQADAICQDVYDAAEKAFGSNGLMGDDPILSDCSSYNVLYIDRMFLEPSVRKTGLGDAILRRVIEHHDAASLAAVLMFPKAGGWDKVADGDPLFGKGGEDGTKRIAAHYKRLGFVRHPKDSKWLYLDMGRYDYDWKRSLPKRSRVNRASRVSTISD